MSLPLSDLQALLRGLDPVRNPGCYVFVSLPPSPKPPDLPLLALFREAEGWTVVLEEAAAEKARLTPLFRAVWITLRVHSALEAVGLTAAVSGVLASAAIPCNIIAGACHDHLFLPADRAEEALRLLQDLSASARSASE